MKTKYIRKLTSLLLLALLVAVNVGWVRPTENSNNNENAVNVLRQLRPFQDPNPIVGPWIKEVIPSEY